MNLFYFFMCSQPNLMLRPLNNNNDEIVVLDLST